MTSNLCWICSNETTTRDVKLRSKKDAVLNHCNKCEFDFFVHANKELISHNQLDKTRLESAGLDIPSREKDFANGYNQSKGYIEQYISAIDRGQHILEIGCSWGYFLKSLQEAGCKPYGLEINSVRAEFVRSNLEIPCVEDLTALSTQELKFKKIFSFYCLEYIDDPKSYFAKLIDMLVPDGEIIFITPNLNDVLKDIWQNNAYQNFFYDECAIGYYSLKAIEKLMFFLKQNNPEIETDVITKQGYSIFNHLYWFFNQRPVNNNTLVGGDQLQETILATLNNSGYLGESLVELINDFGNSYKKLIEENNYGNQIIIRIKKQN